MRPELHINKIGGRFVVARKRWVESQSDSSILANFADRVHAEQWLARYQEWEIMLQHTT